MSAREWLLRSRLLTRRSLNGGEARGLATVGSWPIPASLSKEAPVGRGVIQVNGKAFWGEPVRFQRALKVIPTCRENLLYREIVYFEVKMDSLVSASSDL